MRNKSTFGNAVLAGIAHGALCLTAVQYTMYYFNDILRKVIELNFHFLSSQMVLEKSQVKQL